MAKNKDSKTTSTQWSVRTVINNADGATVHTGDGDQIITTGGATITGNGTTVTNGDNPKGIRQTFPRKR